MKYFFWNILAHKCEDFIFVLIFTFMLSQLIYNYMSSIKSKIFFMGSSFSLTHVSSSPSSESSLWSFLDSKKESTSVFSVTAKAIGLLPHLEGRLMQKDSRDLVPLFLLLRLLQQMLLSNYWRWFPFLQKMWGSFKGRLSIEHGETWV